MVADMAAECVIGIDLGGTKLLAGTVDPAYSVHQRTRREIVGLDQAQLLDALVAAVEGLRAESPAEVAAVGFGVPCLIDFRTGVAISAVNLPISDLHLGEVMAERLGMRVFVDNDANSAALAEWRLGAAQGCDDAIMLTVGTGIGGGLVLGGRLFRGSTGAGAELGHLVVDLDGPPCQGSCPNRGCLEAIASGTALVREANRIAGEQPQSGLGRAAASGRAITGPLVTELAHDGDSAALEVLALIGERLGAGISGLVNAFDPQVVVVGGGVMAAGDLLLEPARAEAARRQLQAPDRPVPIVPARLGVEAGMLGAAVLALDGLAAGALS
jgi:glucokinase